MGRGHWGEGFSGTTIKDTWTKSRGRVEVGEGGGFSWGGVEGWGEKAYNCNWITIKNLKKDIQRNYLENKYTKQHLSRHLTTSHASAQLC